MKRPKLVIAIVLFGSNRLLPSQLYQHHHNLSLRLSSLCAAGICIQRTNIYTEHRAGKVARLVSWRKNDPAERVMVALEGVPCVRISPGMKPWTA